MTQISQIFISDNPHQELSPFLQMATQTVANVVPNAMHKIYFKEELEEWILKEYGTSMRLAFDKLIPYAYKADLARYLLLLKYGGWYFDISIRVVNGGIGVPDEIDLVTFSDLSQNTFTSYGCSNGIIYTKANNVILQYAVESAYKNIREENFGRNSLYPTGPVCFGKAVAKFADTQNVITGTFLDLTPSFENRNKAFVLNDGTLFALHKPGNLGGDLTNLGVEGSNNYGLLYAAGNIYNKSINLPSLDL